MKENRRTVDLEESVVKEEFGKRERRESDVWDIV